MASISIYARFRSSGSESSVFLPFLYRTKIVQWTVQWCFPSFKNDLQLLFTWKQDVIYPRQTLTTHMVQFTPGVTTVPHWTNGMRSFFVLDKWSKSSPFGVRYHELAFYLILKVCCYGFLWLFMCHS